MSARLEGGSPRIAKPPKNLTISCVRTALFLIYVNESNYSDGLRMVSAGGAEICREIFK